MTPLEKANAYITEIADLDDGVLYDSERHLLTMHDERNRLMREVASLKKDKERLDWIQEQKADLFECRNQWYIGFVEIEQKTAAPTARGAINKARKIISAKRAGEGKQ